MNSRPAALIAAVVVLVTGCSAPSESDTTAAREYFENYPTAQENDTASGSTSSSAVGGRANSGVTQPFPAAPNVPGPLEDNTFVDAGTSGFVDPRENPRSTFAVDVDGGSFRVARSLLQDGHLPPPESVRAEEWVNSFDSGFPSPREDDLELRSDQGRAPSANDGTRLVRIGLQGRDVAEDEWRPVALTMVVDTSGSMDIRERLGLVKSSLALLVQHLRPSDTIAIVTYETNATPLLEPTPVRDADTILGAIERLRAGGSTNLEAGLLLGYDQAREAYKEGATNVVLLASDGVANVGVTDGGTLASAIRDNGRRGIHLVTVGYGMGNYNDHLMEQLADQGDGFYEYVDTFEEAQKLFVEDLRAILTPVAKDAKIQVEFDPRTVSAYRLIGYENRALADEDFDNDAVDAGEVGAGHKVTALYEVRPTAQADRGDALGTVRVRWRSVDGDEQLEDSLRLTLTDADPPTGTLGVAAAVSDLAQLVKGSCQVSVGEPNGTEPYGIEPGGSEPSGCESKAVESSESESASLRRLQDRVSALIEQDAPGARDLADMLVDTLAATR
ncbi:MAG: von Willebrand factor type A domain-containing protein [Knoellia sp.]